ncbi:MULTISPECIES: WXG100 family type VII secretion target [Nocardia]|uniref:WXG100 family type VII secretion target n=1 Tax=Nocardia TaxID=1817 RepID=UPI00189360AE|nr:MULTISPECIES: WXG100 family type VII secretion target [Nocardia]MBF6351337.1 WXG100 family type VII secretion target [Nocardia flavorosea]
MAIKFNYGEVEASTGRVSAIIEGMNQNIANMRQLKTALLEGFQGSGAEGYTDVTNELEAKLNAYEGALAGLNGKIVRTSTKGGDMDVVDISVGSMFRA